MDTAVYTVMLIELDAGVSDKAYITNSPDEVTYEGKTFIPSDGIKVSIPPISGTMEGEECKVEDIYIAGTLLTALSNHAPYSKIEIAIKELVLNVETEALVSVNHLFSGLVYQVLPMPLKGYMTLSCRDWKYYTDILAGVPCTEQCSWQYLGGKGCNATTHFEQHQVESVSGLLLTIETPLTDTRPLLFNKGYIEMGGVRIKIKYHSTGQTFQLSKPPPATWVGSLVTIHSGCDRTHKTCKAIYDNEINFLGLGYAMVDYNAFYESP